MIKKILCAVDGSKAAKNAAIAAVDLAKSTNAALTFLTINIIPNRSRRTVYWDATLFQAAEQQSNTQLALAARAAKAAKLDKYDCAVASGNDVAKAICSYADKNKYDLIVVGTGIRNELQRLFLGSVSSAVVSQAHCPVTVVR